MKNIVIISALVLIAALSWSCKSEDGFPTTTPPPTAVGNTDGSKPADSASAEGAGTPAVEATAKEAEETATGIEKPGILVKTPAEPSDDSIILRVDEKTVTYTCKGNSITINGSSNKVTVKGHASGIVINGGFNTVTADGTVDSIVINSEENQIKLNSIGKIQIMNDGNKIQWKSGLTRPAPAIIDLGFANKTIQAK